MPNSRTDTRLAALPGQAATPEVVEQLAKTVLDRHAHIHPERGEDLYCLNLTSFMGERMGPVLVRLREVEAEVERLRGADARVRKAVVDGAAFRSLAMDVLNDLEHGRIQDAERLLREALGILTVGREEP